MFSITFCVRTVITKQYSITFLYCSIMLLHDSTLLHIKILPLKSNIGHLNLDFRDFVSEENGVAIWTVFRVIHFLLWLMVAEDGELCLCVC